ncbi:hypothetical protein SAMD00019534_007570 [Acytostelium subglobosum LB1]|uniref:hypothetical protein n=1 Tax=Acytostelium subglobosum LB1 TaxID=1410327 RepID=UPI000644E024|nr:hypothetical protein SAMD00019534_007570 [Acytostelium subglobosum LB1]GAM17582.1 hypothetical protein SAMD00019534_007570 [Acytostelium subglobosum LB1]|eukprot:XP_012759644.1 hypothetical protein SAMD00019534_007570 [Acytostelium subglobosum LB1]
MANIHPNVKQVLYTEDDIKQRVAQMGKMIEADYKDSKELVFIGILKGSFMFMSDLVRSVHLPNTLVSLDFMSISSYGHSTSSSGVVKINMDLKESIEGKDVIVVEDIIDSGLTLKHLLGMLHDRLPRSINTCVLLRKKEGLKTDVPIKYLGFDIPMVFIIGYGLDFAERYREIPYLGELKEECYKTA